MGGWHPPLDLFSSAADWLCLWRAVVFRIVVIVAVKQGPQSCCQYCVYFHVSLEICAAGEQKLECEQQEWARVDALNFWKAQFEHGFITAISAPDLLPCNSVEVLLIIIIIDYLIIDYLLLWHKVPKLKGISSSPKGLLFVFIWNHLEHYSDWAQSLRGIAQMGQMITGRLKSVNYWRMLREK